MSTFSEINYRRSLPIDVQNGDVFDNCNIAQMNTHTEICAGKTGLTFIECNLLNCDIPKDSVVDDCLTVHKDFCSHLHPDRGLSPVCAENCHHVIDVDEIWIDTLLVETVYHYEDTIV